MELPPYRMPTLRGLLIHTWERSWLYVKKAGTVILAVAVLMWFFCNWPAPPGEAVAGARSPDEVHRIALEHSVVGRIGKAVEPALRPLGFDWRVGTALVGATAAKEVFVAQMGIVFGAGEAADTGAKLREALRANYSSLAGFAMLVYMLIASPCVATCAVTKRESGSWKWAALQWAGLTALGYLVALAIFQAGSLLRTGVGG
jgi:ferrous iron transport protein B